MVTIWLFFRVIKTGGLYERIVQITPKPEGWEAVFFSYDGGELFSEPVICWALGVCWKTHFFRLVKNASVCAEASAGRQMQCET